MFFIASGAQAAEPDCEQQVAGVVAKKLDKKEIVTAQQQLVALGFDTNGTDGVIGSKTTLALKQFCAGAQLVLNDDLLLMLQNHALLYQAQPGWKITLAGAEFANWSAGQADFEEVGKTVQSGSVNGVLALLARFEQWKKQPAAKWSPDEAMVSYALNESDFAALKSGDGVAKMIAALQGEVYASKKDFDAALSAALKDAAEPERYISIVNRNVKPQMSRKLGDTSFNNLKVKNLPEYILQPLLALKNLNYPDQEINAAVAVALEKQGEAALALKPEIVKLAWPCGRPATDTIPCEKAEGRSSPPVTLTDDSLSQFSAAHKDDALAAPVLAGLQKLKNQEQSDDTALGEAVNKVLVQTGAQINAFLPVILANTEAAVTFSLGETEMAAIKLQLQTFTVPEIYLELLGDMRDVDYPNADLFWLAMQAQVSLAGSNNHFRKIIFAEIDKKAASKIDAAVVDALKTAKLPDALLAQLEAVPAGDSPVALKKNVNDLFVKLGESFNSYRTLIAGQAKKTHPFDKTKIIRWSGKSCNCVHDNLAGVVYGFYPYWMAGEEQVIDFSVLNRIAFWGLEFDDKGNLADASRWSGQDSGFIQEAKTYGSKVDLVIYRDNWSTWSKLGSKEKTEAFKKLSANISDQLDVPLSNLFSKLKPYISLGTHSRPLMGDGITLNFDGYPQDADSVQAFTAFISTLRDALLAKQRPLALNIMFRSAEIGNGIFDYQNMLALISTISGDEEKLEGYFVAMLQEPTTDDKKILQRKIEDGLHGKERMKLLRKVVATITFDGHNFDQLTDDVIYAKDNFGGIGFWPQSIASGVVAAPDSSVNNVLHDNYMSAVNGEIALKPAVCQIVCPNRWAFRIAWDVFLLALLLSAILYFGMCSLRTFFEKNFIYYIAGVVVPTVLLTFALMFCDPAWEKISRGNGLLIIVITCVIGYAVWSYRDKKAKANLP